MSPTRITLHARCSGWALAGALLTVGLAAYAQDQASAPVQIGDPSADLLLRIASTLGLPGVVAWIAWQLRGLLAAGITVRLSDEDRALLRKE